MNLQRINAVARQAGYSGYEGDAHGEMYSGYGDEFLDMGKGADFSQEMATGKIFVITIANGSAAIQKVLLTPSLSPSDEYRVIRDGQIPTAAGAGAIATLVGSGSPSTIKEWLAYIADNPSRVLGFQVSSDSALQLAKIITITRKSPYGTLENELIPLVAYRSENAFNDKLATVRRPFQVDNQTEVTVDIPANSTTSFVLYMGASLNVAKALNDKAMIAGGNGAVADARLKLLG